MSATETDDDAPPDDLLARLQAELAAALRWPGSAADGDDTGEGETA